MERGQRQAVSAAVLFVCLGNICRSPLAEAAFRQEAERHGLAVEVDSAGTGNWHVGEPPDRRARALAGAKGAPIDDLRARQIAPEDYRRFTHIFALDAENLRAIRARAPADATAEIALLLDCVPGREGEAVADPYYGDDAAFEATWRDVSEAARALAARFRAP
jgi:protein-tyrosine phosphatase